MKCEHKQYKTVKENEDSVCRHKCICAGCGVELDPIKLTPKEGEKDDIR